MKYSNDEPVVYYADVETGEVVYQLREGDSLQVDTREQKEYRRNNRVIKYREQFIKLFMDSLDILRKETDLTASEYKIILNAIYYIDYKSGILIEDSIMITKGRFMEIVGVSPNTFDSGIKRLMEKKIIGRAKVGRCNCYLVNPFIFMKGRVINDTLYKLFRDSKWNTKRD